MATVTSIAATLAAAALLWVLLKHLTRIHVDPREPPVIQPSIPLIGHIIGMLREGPRYLARVSAGCQYPIFTMPMLNSRTYMVRSAALAAQVQRSSSTLSFDQLVVEVSPRMVELKPETRRILKDVNAEKENRVRMVTEVMHDVVEPLLALKNMQGIGRNQLKHFSAFINEIPKKGFETDLYKMCTNQLVAASMDTFYGPHNPMALHPELIDAFWDWERGVMQMMIDFLPQYTARAAHIALEKMTKAFMEYLENGYMSEAYQLVRKRNQAHVDANIDLEDQARLEVVICLGFNVNAGITLFWVLDNILSRPDLLAEIREEVRQNALVGPGTISFTAIRESCPLFNSVFRETLRHTSPLTSARYVVEDTLIADTYLLRKDSVVQVSGTLMHTDEEIWGDDAASFNPRRFYYTQFGTKSGPGGAIPESRSSQIHPAAFRGFGGGSSLCPGRYFAQMEILTLTAALVLGFEAGPPKGKTEIAWNPPLDDKQFPLGSIKPIRGVNLGLWRRPEYQDTEWVLQY